MDDVNSEQAPVQLTLSVPSPQHEVDAPADKVVGELDPIHALSHVRVSTRDQGGCSATLESSASTLLEPPHILGDREAQSGVPLARTIALNVPANESHAAAGQVLPRPSGSSCDKDDRWPKHHKKSGYWFSMPPESLSGTIKALETEMQRLKEDPDLCTTFCCSFLMRAKSATAQPSPVIVLWNADVKSLRPVKKCVKAILSEHTKVKWEITCKTNNPICLDLKPLVYQTHSNDGEGGHSMPMLSVRQHKASGVQVLHCTRGHDVKTAIVTGPYEYMGEYFYLTVAHVLRELNLFVPAVSEVSGSSMTASSVNDHTDNRSVTSNDGRQKQSRDIAQLLPHPTGTPQSSGSRLLSPAHYSEIGRGGQLKRYLNDRAQANVQDDSDWTVSGETDMIWKGNDILVQFGAADLDYAILKITDDVGKRLEPKKLNDGDMVAGMHQQPPLGEVIITTTHGDLYGNFERAPMLKHASSSSSIHHFWMLHLNSEHSQSAILTGDSGAPVYKDRRICGHVVAGDVSAGVVIVVPIFEVKTDLEAILHDGFYTAAESPSTTVVESSESASAMKIVRARYSDASSPVKVHSKERSLERAGQQQTKVQTRRIIQLGPPTRTKYFFDREDLIAKTEMYFAEKEPESRTPSSLAFYGLGGVGKSSVAQKYAQRQIDRREIDAYFWLAADTLQTLQKSFLNVALKLGLTDTNHGDPASTKELVLDWMCETSLRWLAIYDNAQDMQLLQRYWPTGGRGQVILTCRDRVLAFQLADTILEVQTWDDETGSQFLIYLLSRDLSRTIDADANGSAYELSRRLGGHALAIFTMAGVIHQRMWTIDEFMQYYSSTADHNMQTFSESPAINAIWALSFRSLDEYSFSILQVLCFLAPDGIPQSLFMPVTDAALPRALSFCKDHLTFQTAIDQLLRQALIKRDSTTKTFSIHRLVQSSFRHYLSTEQERAGFDYAVTLLSMMFPQSSPESAGFYHEWTCCEQLSPHVVSLADNLATLKSEGGDPAAIRRFCELNNSCQSFLMEVDDVVLSRHLMDVGFSALKSIPDGHESASIRGVLTLHCGQMHCLAGDILQAIDWLQKSHEILSSAQPAPHANLSWAANSLALAYASNNDWDTALAWHKRCRDYHLEQSSSSPETEDQWPASTRIFEAITLLWRGRIAEAETMASMALQQLTSLKTSSWASTAFAYYLHGNIHRNHKRYKQAYNAFCQAMSSWQHGGSVRDSQFNANALYKLGCVSLDQGHRESAVRSLRNALGISRMRSETFRGVHARILFKLSEALQQEPLQEEEEEAQRYLREASDILLSLSRGPDDEGIEAAYDALVPLIWR